MKRSNQIQRCGLFVFLVWTLFACQVKRPETVLSDKQMENVLYDYHIAKALGEALSYNENYKRVLYVESVYKKYGITEAQFDSSMVWYARNPEVLSKIYENINARLKAEKATVEDLLALREGKPQTSAPGDSVDVWFGQELYRLSGMPLNNKVTFSLPADSNFFGRDTLRWNIRFLYPDKEFDSISAPIMSMSLHYKSDSVISAFRKIFTTGDYSISLQSDTMGELKEVNGFVYYSSSEKKSLLLDKISLMRYHSADSVAVAVTDTLKAAEKDTLNVKKEPENIDKDSLESDKKELNAVPRMRPKPSSTLVQPQKQEARPRLQKRRVN